MEKLSESFNGKRVLITGGLGMIGSTIANTLVQYGAEVTIADSCIEPYGANMFNVREINSSVQISITDIRDMDAIKFLVKKKDIIFNLAGQVSHNDSMDNPYLDADINYRGQLNVLENVKRYNPEAVILHAGSRLQFGRLNKIPVDEKQPLRPRTPYALNKTAAENMYLFYYNICNIPCIIFRIANPYGPRSQMKHSKYSMINWFIRQAIEGNTIKIFGDGEQIRDYIYVSDLADAFLRASVTEKCIGEFYNVGSGVGTKFKDMVKTVIDTVGNGKLEFVPWPKNYINVETGDYVTDIKKLYDATKWKPSTDLKTGINKTFQYYDKYKSYYW
jgi:nucleoside-diphosphate-sugar epimerase